MDFIIRVEFNIEIFLEYLEVDGDWTFVNFIFFYEIDRGEKYIVKKIRFNLHYSFYRY